MINNTSLTKNIVNFFKSLFDMFFGTQKLSGTLFVSGAGSAKFMLPNCPDNVFVDFEDDLNIIPCDPGEDDCLDWNVVCHDCACELTINWKTTGTRTISWQVC